MTTEQNQTPNKPQSRILITRPIIEKWSDETQTYQSKIWKPHYADLTRLEVEDDGKIREILCENRLPEWLAGEIGLKPHCNNDRDWILVVWDPQADASNDEALVAWNHREANLQVAILESGKSTVEAFGPEQQVKPGTTRDSYLIVPEAVQTVAIRHAKEYTDETWPEDSWRSLGPDWDLNLSRVDIGGHLLLQATLYPVIGGNTKTNQSKIVISKLAD